MNLASFVSWSFSDIVGCCFTWNIEIIEYLTFHVKHWRSTSENVSRETRMRIGISAGNAYDSADVNSDSGRARELSRWKTRISR